MNIFAKSDLSDTAIYHMISRFPRRLDIYNSSRNFPGTIGRFTFRTCRQRAGVPTQRIRKLVLKELVDNALDEMDRAGQPGMVTIVQNAEHTYTATDHGCG